MTTQNLTVFLLAAAFLGYALALGLYSAYAFTRREDWASRGLRCLIAAVTAHGWGILAGLAAAHRAGPGMPLWGNLSGSLSLFAFFVGAVFLSIKRSLRPPILGALVLPWPFLALGTALLAPLAGVKERGLEVWAQAMAPHPVPPETAAAFSHWLAIHIPLMFLVYAIFATSFGVGLAYLIQERQIKSKKPSALSYRLPSLEEMDTLIYKMIRIAFPLLTLGLFLGTLWARRVWGRYWGWDPKETGALVIWAVYGTYLFLRLAAGWRGRRTAYLSLAGFGVLLFTYLGANSLSRLHGYLGGGQ